MSDLTSDTTALASAKLVYDCGPPYTPRPRAQQRWVHSCCSFSKLKRALADPDVTAIEADIMVANDDQQALLRKPGDRPGNLPVMAHPSPFSSRVPDTDLSFLDFIECCLADGTRHLKLDFKQLGAVEPCLELLAERWPQLHANGQAVWLNADVLPGPNVRTPPDVPAHEFVPMCRRVCPHAVLSLGWRVGPIGAEQVYSEGDVNEMLRVCSEYRLPGGSVVFAASVRFAERNVPLLGRLLEESSESQILFWTGAGELPIPAVLQTRIHMQLAAKGFAERVGYDVQLASSNMEHCASHLVDCTFLSSRWSRWMCGTVLCCGDRSIRSDLSSTPLNGQVAHGQAGEGKPLLHELSPSITIKRAPTPQCMSSGGQ